MTLLERDFELNVLQRRHSAALQGTGRLVLVTGEAGIGKTTASSVMSWLAKR